MFGLDVVSVLTGFGLGFGLTVALWAAVSVRAALREDDRAYGRPDPLSQLPRGPSAETRPPTRTQWDR